MNMKDMTHKYLEWVCGRGESLTIAGAILNVVIFQQIQVLIQIIWYIPIAHGIIFSFFHQSLNIIPAIDFEMAKSLFCNNLNNLSQPNQLWQLRSSSEFFFKSCKRLWRKHSEDK